MRGKIREILASVILSAALLGSGAAAEGETPEGPGELYARSAVLMDGSSGRILFGKNEGDVMPMASTTKIMTCIVALENAEPGEIVTISAEAAAQPEVHLGVREGETYTLENLLYSLMLESHNDSAVAIAEHVGGSVSGFAEMMNAKAVELGCVNTHYVTPNGLDASDAGGVHATTAAELAKVMAYCVDRSPQKEEFLRITQTRECTFTDETGSRSFSCRNHNAFLDMMDGVISGKTGFTSDAGYCYVCALESGGRLFTAAVLACGWPYNRTYKWSDMKKLMTYGIENFENRTLRIPENFDPLPVENGLAPDGDPWKEVWIGVRAKTEGRPEIKMLLRRDEEIKSRLTIKKSLSAPVAKGTPVGRISYCFGDELLFECALEATEDIRRKEWKDWLVWTVRWYAL